MKLFCKVLILSHLLTAFVNPNLTVKPTNDKKTSEPRCKSIANGISKVKGVLVEIKEEVREIKGKGL